MKENYLLPSELNRLLEKNCIERENIIKAADGFLAVNKSVSDILASKEIYDFPGMDGTKLLCERFFDDWYIYALPHENDHVYGLFKMREQEFDAKEGIPADGDTPGVTISFIAFQIGILQECLENPTEENRKKINMEINRVVAHRGQSHHPVMKDYFIEPESEGAYLVASLYVNHIASFTEDGFIDVPEFYKEIVKLREGKKNSQKYDRLPRFIETLNEKTGELICDHEKIYIKDKECLSEQEAAVILATHTGNVSVYSFAAEVEFHARFLVGPAKIKIPILGKSVYDSAIRADMTISDNEMTGPTPYYDLESQIVKRQCQFHGDYQLGRKEKNKV